MRYFPLFLDIQGKSILVVGGGDVACRKVDTLLRAGAKVTVVSPKLAENLKERLENEEITWINSQYRENLLSNHMQVWATTNNSTLNHQVHNDAKKRNILVNVVDDTPYCDFITPSIVNRGGIQIAISSGGGSPVLVRKIREKIESVLPQNTGLLASFATSKRDDIKKTFPSVSERRQFWERFFSHKGIEFAKNEVDLDLIYQDGLSSKLEVTMSLYWLEFETDVELLSIRALRTMQEAEWVLYPENCPFEFVDLCRRDAARKCYQDIEQLRLVLEKLKSEEESKVCVFIQKWSDRSDIELQKLIKSEGGRLLKIAQE